MAQSRPKGSPKTPGSGRPPGGKNKATIARDLIAAEIAAKTVADARVQNRKLAKEVLEEFMHLFAGLAARHQPLPRGITNTDPKRDPDEGLFDRYAVLAVDCARKLAPYQSPTFQAIMIAPPPDVGQPEQRKRFTLTIFEPSGPPALEHRRGES